MEFEQVTVTLQKLLLNKENDRHGPLPSQRDCIQWMLKHRGKEIYNLAKDIAENGLSPLDRILVLLADEKGPDEFVVWEGNRRITALKLLEDPNRCEDPKTIQRYSRLQEEANSVIPHDIECVLAPSVDEAERLIELRHQGPQEGIGTVPWDGIQKSRHMQRRGKRGRYAFSQQVIDSVIDKLDEELQDKVLSRKFKISTLDRLLNNSSTRDFLGLTNEDGQPRRFLHENETIKGLTKILNDIAEGMKVSEVYDNKKQKEYIERFDQKHVPNQKKTLKDSVAMITTTTEAEQTTSNKRSRPLARNRKKLIGSSVRYRITNKRLNSIYYELRNELLVDKQPNAVAVLFRVFLELAVELYLDQHEIVYHSYNDKLRAKVDKAIKHAESEKWLDKNKSKGIATAINDSKSLFGADSLNAYVHSPDFHPDGSALNTSWDNLQPFFDAILDHLD